MKDFYKLDKYLFEDEKYKSLKLNSKIVYCILKDMIDENINIKIDNNGNKYIEDSRIYLMKKLDITKNTITSVYKELIKADLIEGKWVVVGKANIVCIKNWENKEHEQIHKICEKKKEERYNRAIERITVKDLVKADAFLLQNNINCSQYELNKVLSRLNFNGFTYVETQIIKYGLEYIINQRKNEKDRINNKIIKNAMDNVKKYLIKEGEDVFVIELLINEIIKQI